MDAQDGVVARFNRLSHEEEANLSMESKAVMAGEVLLDGSAVFPIFQSVTYAYAGEADYDSVRYLRCNNTPSQVVLAAKVAAIEGAEAGLVTSSGMAAISSTLLTFLKCGDHILLPKSVYGGTYTLVHNDFVDLGIEFTEVDLEDSSSWEAALRPNTKVFYAETISNPVVVVGDLAAVVAFSKAHGLLSMIDNTFASPINFRPIERGFDIVLESATKYLNGHSDVVAGAVCGSAALIKKVLSKLNHFGGTLDPHACFLLHRGIKTLAVRVQQQNISALALATMLHAHPLVEKVEYAGLPSSRHYQRGLELFGEGKAGGMFAFELKGGAEAAEAFFKAARIPLVAPSLGGVDSLITRPTTTTHVGLTPEQLKTAGITEGTIRVSVGIEGTQDLVADFQQALKAIS